MVLGSQVLFILMFVDKFWVVVEILGVFCFFGGMVWGLLGCNYFFYIWENCSVVLKKVDVIVLVGIVCDFCLFYGCVFSYSSKIIIVNCNWEEMLFNLDIFWKFQEVVQGDVGFFVLKLVEGFQGQIWVLDWVEELWEVDWQKEQIFWEKVVMFVVQYLNLVQVLQLVEEMLFDNLILVVDGGDFVGIVVYLVQFCGFLCWFDFGVFGILGVGVGFVFGVKLCWLDVEVWCLFGDGVFGYSFIEFDIFVRYKILVMVLVGNDVGWIQIFWEQVFFLGSNVVCGLVYIDYYKVVMGLGVWGLLFLWENEDQVVKVLYDVQQQC